MRHQQVRFMQHSLKIVPQPVRRQVEDALREAIITGRFLPGDHLPDRVLCEAFGTSRSVVREAVRLLEAEGLIVVHPNRGPFVAPLSVAEAREIYEVRAALESLAGEGFARHATQAQRTALRAVYEELRDRGSAENRQALLDMKRRFYKILSQGCGNAYAARMLDRLLCRNAQLRATSLSSPDRLPRTIAEIGEIIEAVESDDPAAAAAACRRHVEQAAAIALAILAEEQESQSASADGG
jgi:GntR family transcriptional regulator, trigonelline degradation regulator